MLFIACNIFKIVRGKWYAQKKINYSHGIIVIYRRITECTLSRDSVVCVTVYLPQLSYYFIVKMS